MDFPCSMLTRFRRLKYEAHLGQACTKSFMRGRQYMMSALVCWPVADIILVRGNRGVNFVKQITCCLGLGPH